MNQRLEKALVSHKELSNTPYSVFCFIILAMHSLPAAGRPRLSETEPKWFVFETS